MAISRSASRRLFVVVVGFLLVASLATAGFSGVGTVTGQAANGTNATGNTSASAPDGQLGRLNGSNGSQPYNATAAEQWAKNLSSMYPRDANEAAFENPEKTQNLLRAMQAAGIPDAKELLEDSPKTAAREYLQKATDSSGGSGSGVGPGVGAGADDGGGGGGGGGLLDFSVQEDVIQPTMQSLKKMMGDATHWILEQTLEIIVGTPVPTDDDGGIVFIPTNQPWASLYHNFFIPYVFPLAAVIALLGMLIECGLMPWRALRNPTYDQSRAFVGFAITLIAIIFTMPIISIMHLFVDILATNVAPSAAELTQSTKGMFKLSAGAIFGVVVAYIVGLTEVFLLGFIYALRYGALFYIPWFLPLLIAVAYNAPHKRLSNLASHLLWQYIGLLITVVPVAFLLRIAYEADWDVGLGGLMGFLASGTAFIIAIGLPIITSISLFKAAPSVQSVASGAAGYVAGSRATDYARQAPGQAARGGYRAMESAKTSIVERVTAQKNTPERGQSSIYDFEDREYPRSYPPEQGDL